MRSDAVASRSRASRLVRRFGLAGFLFFAVKGLLWLAVPAVLWAVGS